VLIARRRLTAKDAKEDAKDAKTRRDGLTAEGAERREKKGGRRKGRTDSSLRLRMTQVKAYASMVSF
jgi:hypothetical protein